MFGGGDRSVSKSSLQVKEGEPGAGLSAPGRGGLAAESGPALVWKSESEQRGAAVQADRVAERANGTGPAEKTRPPGEPRAVDSPSGAEKEVSQEDARAQLSADWQKHKTIFRPQLPHLQHGENSTNLVGLWRLMS